MKRCPRTNPGPFAIGPSGNQTGNPHFTSRGNQQILSQKDPSQAVGPLLWLGARRHRGADAPHHQSPSYPTKLGCHTLTLQGTHLYEATFTLNGSIHTDLCLSSISSRTFIVSQLIIDEDCAEAVPGSGPLPRHPNSTGPSAERPSSPRCPGNRFCNE